MTIIGTDDGVPIRPQKTTGQEALALNREQLLKWSLSVPEDQRTAPLLSLQDVLTLLKDAKEAVGEGVHSLVPQGIPLEQRPKWTRTMRDVGQGACEFLGYGLVEACRGRMGP